MRGHALLLLALSWALLCPVYPRILLRIILDPAAFGIASTQTQTRSNHPPTPFRLLLLGQLTRMAAAPQTIEFTRG